MGSKASTLRTADEEDLLVTHIDATLASLDYWCQRYAPKFIKSNFNSLKLTTKSSCSFPIVI